MYRQILTGFLAVFALEGAVAQTSVPVRTISTVRNPVPAVAPVIVKKKDANCREINKPKRKVSRVTSVKKNKPITPSAQK